jgi:hypothetical protein
MVKKEKISERILVGITGDKENHWREKIEEIEKFGIKRVALFLERFGRKQRLKIYSVLSYSNIKEIPLVHIRNDMAREELVFLANNFSPTYFTIHESSFEVLEKWKGFYKKLFLEMDADDFVSELVEVKRIGGFCVDLSHFKMELRKWSKEFEYIFKRKHIPHYFDCNHLNGYSPENNDDLHIVKSLKDFDYLRTLPKFIFGNVIALEVENSIFEQLEFKKYLSEFLKDF